jgi:hypothetical protein
MRGCTYCFVQRQVAWSRLGVSGPLCSAHPPEVSQQHGGRAVGWGREALAGVNHSLVRHCLGLLATGEAGRGPPTDCRPSIPEAGPLPQQELARTAANGSSGRTALARAAPPDISGQPESTGAPHCNAREHCGTSLYFQSTGEPHCTARKHWGTSLYCQRALGHLTVLPESTRAPHCTTNKH